MTADDSKSDKVKEKKTVNVFRITGNFRKGKKIQKFTKELLVKNKQEAEEHVLSIMGSKHRAKRKEITIEKIEKIPHDKVTDLIIKQQLGGS
jgi:large subunit ribosomal protein LX